MKDLGCTVLAVALDQPDAARPWIDAAKATYPCLVDRDHLLGDLYNIANVPQAVWIDEEGRIVRPPETAGSIDAFRAMDRTTATLPADVQAKRDRIKREYLDAVRDWARHGAASRHAMSAERAGSRLARPQAATAEGHAHFRLGMALLRAGQADEAAAQLAEASRLHPESWAIWRQAAPKNERGLAAGAGFWNRVDALGSRNYYEPADLGAPPTNDGR